MSDKPDTRKAMPLPPRLDIGKALATPPPEPDFVFPGLPTGAVGGIVAPGATGKTLLLLQMCMAVATGTPTLGGLLASGRRMNAPAKAVLVVAEETMDIMHARLHAAFSALASLAPTAGALSPAELRERMSENLDVRPLAGSQRMLLDGRDPQARDGLDTLRRLAERARLVVIDPLRQFHTGDENDSWAMTSVLQDLQGIACAERCALLVAHHTNKASTLGGQGDRAGASRGSAAFTDALRWQPNLSALDDTLGAECGISVAERRHHIRADLAKANYVAPQPPTVLRRERGGAFSLVQPATKAVGTRRRTA